jgi:O-antigen polymerase
MHSSAQRTEPKWAFAIIILITSLIIGSLLGFGNWFVHTEYTGLYLYEFIAVLLIVLTAIKILLTRKEILFPDTIQIALIAYGGYILVHGLWIGKNFNPYHEYIIISCTIAVCLPVMIGQSTIHIVLRAIVLIASLEAIVCLLQSVKLLASLNQYFDVTGTMGNPNVTAMFLAMALCAAPFAINTSGPIVKKIILLAGFVILVALVLLKCRTAWIGLISGALAYFYYSGVFKSFCEQNRRRAGSILVSIFIGLLLLTVTIHMYQAKKASADGRKLIWKIAALMIKDRPVFGTGFGDFEKHYNLYQADYFKNGNGSEQEKLCADHVNMAYNELIEHGVNGGITGMLVLAALFCIVLVAPRFRKPFTDKGTVDNKAYFSAYSGLVCLCTMSMFNFTLPAVPVMALFVFYLSILQKKDPVKPSHTKKFSAVPFFLASVLLIGGIWLLTNVFQTARAAMATKTLVIHSNRNTSKWDALIPKMARYQSFWISYGDMLYRRGQYSGALTKYQIAQNFSSEKNLYLNMAACYEKTGNDSAAVNCYIFLSNIQPGWLQPKYRLLKIYQSQGDSLHIIEQATGMLALRPKVESGKSRFYQNYARSVLTLYRPAVLEKRLKIPMIEFKQNHL